jgi:hypothetical protein
MDSTVKGDPGSDPFFDNTRHTVAVGSDDGYSAPGVAGSYLRADDLCYGDL